MDCATFNYESRKGITILIHQASLHIMEGRNGAERDLNFRAFLFNWKT